MYELPIIVTQYFKIDAQTVWAALTEKDAMKIWYFDLAEFKPQMGFRFTFTGGPPEKVYVNLCDITEAVVNEKIAYSWRYEGYEGCSYVSFHIRTENDGTLLTLTHSDLHTFPAENPDFARHNFEMGWDQIIHQNLTAFLAGKA